MSLSGMVQIKARFESMKQGRNALESLKNSGYVNACLDMIEKLYTEHAEEIGAFNGEQACDIISLVELYGPGLRNKRKATPPGEYPNTALEAGTAGIAVSTCLKVAIDASDINKVQAIIRSFGGEPL